MGTQRLSALTPIEPMKSLRSWIAVPSIVIIIACAAWFALPAVAPDPYGVPDAPRHIFIDGGAHKGESIQNFKRARMFRDHRWDIMAFECNPDLAAHLENTTDAKIYNQAMWTNNGTLEFFLTQETTCSSLFQKAGMGKLEKRRVEVPSIDFAAWLADNTQPQDFVILKLDVEGAEYPILDHLLAKDVAQRIDILFVEFHNAWVDIPKTRDEALIRQLKERGVRIEFAQSHEDGNWFARPRWPWSVSPAKASR